MHFKSDGLFPFIKRCYKEILRDPLSLIFGAAFPVILMIVLQIINKSGLITNEDLKQTFALSNQLVSISVFTFSFASFYAGILVSRDRDSGFLHRLYSTDMSILDYFLGYVLPLLFVSFLQSVMCMTTSLLLNLIFHINDLNITLEYLLLIAMLVPVELIFIFIGMMLGSSFSVRESVSIFFVIMVIVGLTGNIFFPVTMFGNVFTNISKILPFYPSIRSLTNLITDGNVFPEYFITLGYSICLFVISFFIFKRKIHK